MYCRYYKAAAACLPFFCDMFYRTYIMKPRHGNDAGSVIIEEKERADEIYTPVGFTYRQTRERIPDAGGAEVYFIRNTRIIDERHGGRCDYCQEIYMIRLCLRRSRCIV